MRRNPSIKRKFPCYGDLKVIDGETTINAYSNVENPLPHTSSTPNVQVDLAVSHRDPHENKIHTCRHKIYTYKTVLVDTPTVFSKSGKNDYRFPIYTN